MFPGIGNRISFKLPNSMTATTGRRNTTSGGGVTSQYDRKTVYRKKKMPRYKKRRWVKLVKQVNAVISKGLGSKTVVRNQELNVTHSGSGQNYGHCNIYGTNGQPTGTTNSCGADDMYQIFTNDVQLGNGTNKAKFESAIMDITFTNGSTSEDATQNLGIEVDVYDIVYRKTPDASFLNSIFNQSQTTTLEINTGKPGLLITDRGVTPFEFPDAASKGIKILKKIKYFLGKDEVATYQLRDARNRIFTNDSVITTDNNYVYPGATRTILFICKGVPTGNAAVVTKNLRIGCTRKYLYKVMENNTTYDNLL